MNMISCLKADEVPKDDQKNKTSLDRRMTLRPKEDLILVYNPETRQLEEIKQEDDSGSYDTF